MNIFVNAIKYSPDADRIEVTVGAKDDGVFIAVRDYGIGIRPEDQGKIFDRFYRVTGDEEATFPGMGIGLYFCKEVVAGHGGTIAVAASELGKGTTITVFLPQGTEKTKTPSTL